MTALPSRIIGRQLACADRKIRSHPTEQRVHLRSFGVGQSNLRFTLDSPGKLVDARNDRQCLGGGRQQMRTPVMRIRHARDKSVRLQPIEQANKSDRRDVEAVSECGLVATPKLREMDEHGAPRAGHPGQPGAYRFVAASAPQPGDFV
jgi:hypothetical protein